MSDKDVKYTASKSDIWNAYKAMKLQLDSNQSTVVSTTDASNKAKVTKAVEVASNVDVSAVEGSVTALITKIGEATEQYGSIVTAIDAKKQELKDIHDLEVEANSLVAVVATKDALVAEKTTLAETIVSDAHSSANAIITEANDRATEIRANINDVSVKASQEHTREQEEYKYSFARKKQAEEDSLKDALDAKVKIVVAREDAVTAREDISDEKDEVIDSLTNEIEVSKIHLNDKIEDAYVEAKAKAEKSANFAKAMDRKTHEADVSIKNARIETLEEKVDELNVQLSKAQAQVADANDKVASMATSALKAQADADTITRVSEIAASSGKK